MKLTTKRLILRGPTMKDAKGLVSAINNINISKWLLVVPYPYTMKDAKLFINHCKKGARKKPRTSYNFAIELKSKHKLIGGSDISRVNRDQGTADLGYWLSEDY